MTKTVISQKGASFQKNEKTPVASLRRRKQGLGVPIHITMQFTLIDIDYFKKVNDEHGHQVGDEILVLISNTIASSCRVPDHIGRYGGEEFLIVLPETINSKALILAERIRKNIKELKFKMDLQLTVSIGVASLNIEKKIDLHTFIKQADDAVYKAKSQGRNQVVST